MEWLITFSSISAVTLLSMVLALLIEVALLKAIFHFMSHMIAEPAAEPVGVGQASHAMPLKRDVRP